MQRKIAAALAFNVYALVLVQAFWAATPLIFDGREVDRHLAEGTQFRFEDWGFGEHYLWRLFAAVFATAVAGFICGALARDKGRNVALVANIPSGIGWLGYAWMFFFLLDSYAVQLNDANQGLKTAYGVISVVAVPLTFWLAGKFGELGEKFQIQLDQPGRTLGVGDWHWAWMWLSLSPYGYKIVVGVMAFVATTLKLWTDRTLLGSVIALLSIAIVAAWLAPLVFTYQTLAGGRFAARSPVQRGAIVVATLGGGYVVATATAAAVQWILGKAGF